MSATWNAPAALGQTVVARTDRHGLRFATIVSVSIRSCCPYSIEYTAGGRNEFETCCIEQINPADIDGSW